MEGSIYDCINHISYVSKKKPTFEKILASMSKFDTVDNLDKDKLREAKKEKILLNKLSRNYLKLRLP